MAERTAKRQPQLSGNSGGKQRRLVKAVFPEIFCAPRYPCDGETGKIRISPTEKQGSCKLARQQIDQALLPIPFQRIDDFPGKFIFVPEKVHRFFGADSVEQRRTHTPAIRLLLPADSALLPLQCRKGISAPTDTSPECYHNTDCFLYSNGYLVAKLTGLRSIDACRASLSLLYDPQAPGNFDWEPELLDFFGISKSKLPDIYDATSLVGGITAEAAALTGLPTDVRVMAGAMDSMCAMLGSGAVQDGQLLDIGGSAGGIAALSKTPRAFQSLYLVRSILPGHWCNIGPLDMSGSMFTWFVERFLPGVSFDDYFQRLETLAPLSPNVQFLPYLGGSRHPYWSVNTAGHFVDITPMCTLDDFCRAVVDGLACAYRRIYDDFTAIGLKPVEIVTAGGDSKSRAWLQAKADFLQLPYRIAPTYESSARGCGLIAAKYMNYIDDYFPGTDDCTKEPGCRILPRKELSQAHAEYYHRFLNNCRLLYETGENNCKGR